MCGHHVFVAVLLWITGMLNDSFGERILFTTIDGCGEAPVIDNGDIVERSRVQLKYQCRPGYNLHGEDTVLCFSNSSWSDLPLCKENMTCIYPEIANANYTEIQYVRNNEKIWIKCNAGYEDWKKRATARCENGHWTELPVCEKMASSCGPPPSIPNGIIINQVHTDVFPEDTRVLYMCETGFELETNTNEAVCSYDQWFPVPSCRLKETNQEHVPLVTGHPMVTRGRVVHRCNSEPPLIDNAERFYDQNSMIATYRCSHYYKLEGRNTVRCENGQWTRAPTCEEDFCKLDTSKYPDLEEAGDVYIKSGTEIMLGCKNTKEARAECRNKQLYLTECCRYKHRFNLCDYVQIKP